MSNFFNMDGKFFTLMTRVADLMILNFVWILCSIPLVTIGASTTALYYVTQKMIKNEESYIVKSFFRSFISNLKQSTIIWLILIVVGIFLGLDLYILANIEMPFTFAIRCVILAVIVLYLFIATYVFAIQSKFVNTIKNTIKNAFFMSIRHLPYTVLLLALGIVPIVAMLFIPGGFAVGFLVYMLGGFSLTSLAGSYFFDKIFSNYVPKDENDITEMKELDFDSIDNSNTSNMDIL